MNKAVPCTFHPFSLLPFELHHKIWRNAFPAPRIIKVNPYGRRNDAPRRDLHALFVDDDSTWYWAVDYSHRDYPWERPDPCPLLSTNSESRSIYRSFYELSDIWERNHSKRRPYYIDFRRNFIYREEMIYDSLFCSRVPEDRLTYHWYTKPRFLIIHELRNAEQFWGLYNGYDPTESAMATKSRESMIWTIIRIVGSYPQLRHLLIAIHGRRLPCGFFVDPLEPSEEVDSGSNALPTDISSQLLSAVQDRWPGLHLPEIGFVLHARGRDPEILKEIWDIRRADGRAGNDHRHDACAMKCTLSSSKDDIDPGPDEFLWGNESLSESDSDNSVSEQERSEQQDESGESVVYDYEESESDSENERRRLRELDPLRTISRFFVQ